ncbi:unnamed protein product [Linum trigynum]|uniref:Uncharacterized protein n=1 Tax=Linum trigynum TaxID=586398 RepID=A0AAV2GUH3_9ROSI
MPTATPDLRRAGCPHRPAAPIVPAALPCSCPRLSCRDTLPINSPSCHADPTTIFMSPPPRGQDSSLPSSFLIPIFFEI